MKKLRNIECILCNCFWLLGLFGIVFLSSDSFIDSRIIPKWLVFAIMGIGVIIYVSLNYLTKNHNGFKLFLNSSNLKTIMCVVILTLSVYGILQYFGVAGHSRGMPVCGCYDNPAGFAITVSASLSFIILGFRSNNRYLRIFHITTFLIAIIALILSESRAGILSVIVMFVLGGHKFINIKPTVKWGLVIALLIMLVPLAIQKYDSASGRLLIWTCTLLMIREKLLFGYGQGGFESHYMDFQAAYLGNNPDNDFIMLADTVQYPFNEYLYILTNYGIIGLGIVLLYLGYLLYRYTKNRTPERLSALLAIISVAVFAMFSYPLMYPFVWFILAYGSLVLFSDIKIKIRHDNWIVKVIAMSAIIICVLVGWKIYRWSVAEIRWATVAKTVEVDQNTLDEFGRLYRVLSSDRYFMYNYAYTLYSSGNYDKAASIVAECRRLWADYDVEILSGTIAEKMDLIDEAIEHYTTAMNMCPNRFSPHYMLMRLYDSNGDVELALEQAVKIVGKPIKVQSATVDYMVQAAEEFIKNTES